MLETVFEPNKAGQSQITVPFYSNPPVSNLSYDVNDSDGMSIKDNASMKILNTTVRLVAHGIVVKIKGQAFIWRLTEESNATVLNRSYMLKVWNAYGTSIFWILERSGYNYSVKGMFLHFCKI